MSKIAQESALGRLTRKVMGGWRKRGMHANLPFPSRWELASIEAQALYEEEQEDARLEEAWVAHLTELNEQVCDACKENDGTESIVVDEKLSKAVWVYLAPHGTAAQQSIAPYMPFVWVKDESSYEIDFFEGELMDDFPIAVAWLFAIFRATQDIYVREEAAKTYVNLL